MAHLIGVDVGGTNTDLVYVDTETGELRVAKVPSTPSNQADGLMHGIDILGVPLKDVDLLIHGNDSGDERRDRAQGRPLRPDHDQGLPGCP